ncbi:MAG: ABC transporter substrate-binding protein [Paracoccaceae bacterium]
MIKRTFLKGALIGVAMTAIPMAAFANDTVKVTYMKIPPLVPMTYAIESGIMAAHGLDIDLSVVNSGPDLMTALASGSSEIGQTAASVALLARSKGLPIQIFGTGDLEHQPDYVHNWLVTRDDTGITDLMGLEGKTVGVVDKNSPAELAFRSHMVAAGADADTLSFVAIPFPQLPAALEVGNVDAVHVGEPFHAQIMNSDKITGVELAIGLIADPGTDYALGGWFAQEDWLADERNQDIAKRFLAAMLEANRALAADRSLIDAILVRDFGMPAEIASGIPMPLGVDSILAEPGHYGVLISELEKTGMIEAGSVTTDDVIKTIQYE